MPSNTLKYDKQFGQVVSISPLRLYGKSLVDALFGIEEYFILEGTVLTYKDILMFQTAVTYDCVSLTSKSTIIFESGSLSTPYVYEDKVIMHFDDCGFPTIDELLQYNKLHVV